MPSLAFSQPVDPTSDLQTKHLQVATPEEISIDPYKIDINIDDEVSLSSDEYSATQGYTVPRKVTTKARNHWNISHMIV